MPSLKEALERQLIDSRNFTEGLLSVFRTPDDWTHQVHPQTNHAMWFIGHISGADNYFIKLLGGEPRAPQGYGEKFGANSKPSPNASDYPPAEEVLQYMRERRKALLALLAGKSESDLNAPAPSGVPPMVKDVAGIFQLCAWHEGLHAGQISVVRRALGHPSVLEGPPRKPEPAQA